MFLPAVNQWQVSDGRHFELARCTHQMKDIPENEYLRIELEEMVQKLFLLQSRLWADNRFSILCVFQAMDAAGKDSTIRRVFTGVNPAGIKVSSFKKPSSTELEHDFLWRTYMKNPEDGTIAIFNRSYYEEVLVVKVHEELLQYQSLMPGKVDKDFWAARYESIRDMERHLSRNGTIIMKFFLNVSKDEQKKRFLKRLEDPAKQWKFSKSDIEERSHWDSYMSAYESAIQETATPHAPWYVIPANSKKQMQWAVAKTVLETMESLPLEMPNVAAKDDAVWQSYIDRLNDE